MRFKLDENLPTELLADLVGAGHDADTVFDEDLVGSPDENIMEACRAGGQVLFTLDKGIADIRKYPPGGNAGVVLLRPTRRGRGMVTSFVRSRLAEILGQAATGRLLVVTDSGIRRR